MPGPAKYNEKLSASDQIDGEEDIAYLLFDEELNLSETDCAKLSRAILLKVLTKFRPDLVQK